MLLPGTSGIELARRLKRDELTGDIPIIMLTAKGEEDNKIQGLEVGADDYITKPFSPRELVARLKAVLRQLANNDIKGIPVDASLQGYLHLMAALVDAQAKVTSTLPAETFALPPSAEIALSVEHNMPPLPVNGARTASWRTVFAALLDELDGVVDSQPQVAAVLAELRALDSAQLEGCAASARTARCPPRWAG